VVDVDGTFAQQEAVNLVVVRKVVGGHTAKGQVVGKALVNYSSTEIARIMGQQSSKIQELLGYAGMHFLFLSSLFYASALMFVECRAN